MYASLIVLETEKRPGLGCVGHSDKPTVLEHRCKFAIVDEGTVNSRQA